MLSRREWIAMICAAPGAAPLVRSAAAALAPASPVAIARCASYDEDVTARLAAIFDQLGGLDRLVRAKTVTIKVNMTGSPGMRIRGKAPALTHYTHPKVLGATAYLMGRAGARRIRFVESAWASAGPLEEMMLDAGWNVRQLAAAAPVVEFENINALGKHKRYARFPVPGGAYMYPAYDLNQALEETDVMVSVAKLKNHATCGVTLSLKNCFGNLPASIYGDDAGRDEPNEKPASGREPTSCASTTATAAATWTMSFTSEPRCKHVDRLREAGQQRADGFGAADALQQLVGDVAGFQVGKHQHVGAALERAERVGFVEDLRHHGGIGLHFAIDHQAGRARWRTSSTARRTFSASGWRVLPKLENESMATRGS
jgi:hypothetical protein